MSPVPAHLAPDVPLLGALYVFEASALLAIVASHRKDARPSGALLVVAAVALLLSAVVILERYRTRARRGGRCFGFTLMLNLVPVVLLLVMGELTVRMLARPTPRGPVVMDTPLMPWRWSDVVTHNQMLLARAERNGSYLVSDERLGWVVGPSRRSADGLYFSSAEGLRSPVPGVTLRERLARRRIALVGDSFTFGLEVSNADSWGHRLEQALGPGVQVLNFGVDGYGVDQAYLRYGRDVRPWRPDVVILGLINHDLFRSLAVYSFVSFPGWPFPFAKPRFVVEGDRLVLLNLPLPSPRSILAAGSVAELPFVEYDPATIGRTESGTRLIALTSIASWPPAIAPEPALTRVARISGYGSSTTPSYAPSFVRRAGMGPSLSSCTSRPIGTFAREPQIRVGRASLRRPCAAPASPTPM